MKRYLTILVLLCSCLFPTYAQHSCKDCVRDLYKVLSTYPSDNLVIGDGSYSIRPLYQDKSDSTISTAINNARIFSYGNPLDSVVELNLGNKALYFMVNTEPPRSYKYQDINDIYDGRGRNLLNNDDYLKFPAVINDTDGFTNVREGPSKKYKVKNKILQNEIFLYTPIFGENWYRALF